MPKKVVGAIYGQPVRKPGQKRVAADTFQALAARVKKHGRLEVSKLGMVIQAAGLRECCHYGGGYFVALLEGGQLCKQGLHDEAANVGGGGDAVLCNFGHGRVFVFANGFTSGFKMNTGWRFPQVGGITRDCFGVGVGGGQRLSSSTMSCSLVPTRTRMSAMSLRSCSSRSCTAFNWSTSIACRIAS